MRSAQVRLDTSTRATFFREIKKETLALDQNIREGKFQKSLALIAGLSGLFSGVEVTLEHYKGSYGQRIMYSPVILSTALFGAGIGGFLRPRIARTLLPLASIALLMDGVVGFGFHIRGIARKPGGWRIPIFNIVMGPPLFAPLLLGIGGYLGLIASMLRSESSSRTNGIVNQAPWTTWHLVNKVREGKFQKQVCAAMMISAILNGFESLYSHYKTNFSVPAQWIPIALTPPLVLASSGAIVSPRIARTYLPAVSVIAVAAGGIGFFYHLRGSMRRPGGLKLPLYNLVYGPPVFAPLLFAATGFMGLLASRLRRES